MTNSATLPSTHPPSQRPRAARIWLGLAAALTGLIAAALLAVGGFALWGDSQKDADGFLSSGSERFATDTRALVSENLDVDLDGAESILDDGRLGTVRLDVTSDSGEPVFVGIGRTSQVSEYLEGVSRATVTDVDFAPFTADYSRQSGARRPSPPAQIGIWTTSAHGAGRQTLTWDVPDGDWSVVVMNADGSPRVEADIRAGAELPILATIGWGGVIGGTILLMGAAGLVVLAVRRGTRPR